jgi:hypothetical protein
MGTTIGINSVGVLKRNGTQRDDNTTVHQNLFLIEPSECILIVLYSVKLRRQEKIKTRRQSNHYFLPFCSPAADEMR